MDNETMSWMHNNCDICRLRFEEGMDCTCPHRGEEVTGDGPQCEDFEEEP